MILAIAINRDALRVRFSFSHIGAHSVKLNLKHAAYLIKYQSIVQYNLFFFPFLP